MYTLYLRDALQNKYAEINELCDSYFQDRIMTFHHRFPEGSKSDIDLLAKDNSNTYSLSLIDGENLHMVRLGDDGLIYIETSGDALSIHEITHVIQSIEAGRLDFNSNGELKNSGVTEKSAHATVKKIAANEVEAYKSQYSFNPSSLPKNVSNINKIDIHYVVSLRDRNGNIVYPIIKDFSDQLKRISKNK